MIPENHELWKDPFVQEYMHVFSRNPPSVQTAAEMIGEKKVYAHLASKGITYFFPNGKYQAVPALKEHLSSMISDAPIYFLSEEMFPILLELQEKCRKAAEESATFTRRKMPSPWFWFSCARGWAGGIDGVPHIDVRLEIDTSSILEEMMREFELSKEQVPNSYGFYIDPERGLITLPAMSYDFSREAILMLIEEKICRVEYEKPHRGLLRTCKKLNTKADARVGIIRLRGYESSKTTGVHSGESSIEYAHRWLVRGHVRNQFYPSSAEHKLIWIDPHIKGPEDKPFRESIRVLAK